MLYRLGHLVAAHPVVVLVFWIALAAGVTLTVKQVGANTDNNVSLPGTGSQAATDLLQAGFPPQQNGSNPIIFHVRGAGKVTDKDNKQAITDSYKAIKKIKYVHSATSPFAQGAGAQISKDKKTAFISALLNVSSNDLTERQAQRVLDAANPGKRAGMEVVGGGSIGSTLSPNDTSTSDVIGILAAMIILTFTFGTVVAMGMPIGTAILGLTTALGVIGLMGHLVSVPDISTTIATMIGLAVGIDYALFLVTRHRGQMREGMELHESIALAVGTAGTAVVFAGCTVVVALLSLFVAGIPLVAALGYTAAVAVGTAVLAAVTLLPALMALAGRHIESLALPLWLHPKDDPQKEGIWGRWAGFVTRHPLIPVLLAVALMVPLIIPVLSLELGQEDIGQTNPATMQRRAYDLMSQAYGPGFNGPLIIAVAVAPKAKGDPKVVDQENQLKSLQKTLKQEQKEGKQQQAEISSEQAQLKQQQAKLEHKQALLNQQSASLQAQRAQLEQQQAALEAQGARLQAENNQLNAEQHQLEAQAAALKQDAKALAVRLVANRAEQAKVERKLQKATNPTRIAELQARLKRLKQREQEIIAQLRHDKAEAKKLLREAKSLVAKKEALKQQKQTLEAQSAQLSAQAASLQAQAASLEQQGAALQQQGAELQAQANALQQQGDQLKALQKKAKKQQKQADKLHSQLVTTLTKAGGDIRGTDPRLVKLQNALIKTKGDKLVSPPSISKKGNDVVYSVIATTAPSSQATVDLVRHLRSTVIPSNSEQGVQAFVGGSTAGNVDLAAEISSRLPLVIITILILSMLVLLVAFRSVLIPLQAAATNFVTAMAAFGILTACFQWGWGIDIVGVSTDASSVPIASYVPLMMFAILFGLSMDYQVFLLSSVDHHRLHGEDDRTSVRLGLKTSARVISAAALIMISVFSSFILNGDPVVKQFGVGLSTAVLLAATMVLMLAPAVLTLLGRWAWWMPAWLGRIVPTVDIEGTSLGGKTQPAPATQPPPEPA
ncbi:MAG TPA: MMPL family transporter [Gaiellales bacterium]|nr:MMPL family transporter [Gaiellales bacterium]